MHDGIEQLQKFLGDRASKDVLLAPYTTFKIGGPADLFMIATTNEQLIDAYSEAKRLNVPVTILGGGTNILIADKGIRGLVIKNMTKEISARGIKGTYNQGESQAKVYIEASSGVMFNTFVRWCIEEGYKGVEMHLGLPGTVGGAVYMNSKWTHPPGAVGDVVHQAKILKETGETVIVDRSYFSFAYDYSSLQKTKDIVLSVTFELSLESKEVLWQQANASIEYRRKSQPQGVSTPGCTFRNISQSEALAIPTPEHTTSAGYLIDHAGLKGLINGKAQISPVHANFIINLGGATAEDVLGIIHTAKQKVKEIFGVSLTEEIVLLGEW